ncbi:Transcriptional activator HlyU [Vibrio aerogenes CECT 7868]|uniref:Transcriptional activator HlyU n=1 Tax=Vibrio aerogenes CECT 7868 TaxID=1216006 RepID=A0A1M5ZMP1_9VIBR|nr:HlyU family transcriptional regulator [Vibrio aerogenes]SHI25163.1 Transcriptional activator HlyU [Vibrio aerogenes CECT 7868]
MGFLSRLFGKKTQQTQAAAEPVEYKGFFIYPEAIAESGQYRIAGRILLEKEGETHEHRFIRSDVVISRGDADELMVAKAKMMIDQMGEKIFH